MSKQLNILVLEDEQRAGEKLIDLVNEVSAGSQVTWLRSIENGLQFLKEHSEVDLVFSDIELLDGNAFEIYDKFTPKCPIIFCTAYDKFYVNAFNTNGIAYLLKPYSKDEFNQAWKKYETLFAKESEESAIPLQLIQQMKSLVAKESAYKTSFSVKKRDGVFILKVSDISYFQAQGDFVFAFDQANAKHVLSYSLSHIESLVDPESFFRINRSEIVNRKFVLKYNRYTKNRLSVTLTTGADDLYTSNSRSPEFKVWLER